MANIILPQVSILNNLANDANLLVEQNGEINRFAVTDLDIGGGDVTIDLASGINSAANPIDADSLGGYPAEDYARLADITGKLTVDLSDYNNGQMVLTNADLIDGHSIEEFIRTEDLLTVAGPLRNLVEDTTYPGCYYRMLNESTKEWLNPPMVVGTEYQTMKRYKGNPIYTKMINLGTLPAASEEKIVSSGLKNSYFVTKLDVFAYDTTDVSLVSDWGEVSAWLGTNYTKVHIYCANDISHLKGIAIIEYSKVK